VLNLELSDDSLVKKIKYFHEFFNFSYETCSFQIMQVGCLIHVEISKLHKIVMVYIRSTNYDCRMRAIKESNVTIYFLLQAK
jgi:hypothetical protein